MEELSSDLSSGETGGVNETKKALYDRLKMTMQAETQDASTGTTRRGFLNAVVTGGMVFGIIGSGGVADASWCKECMVCNPCIICVTPVQMGQPPGCGLQQLPDCDAPCQLQSQCVRQPQY